jgi:hypothetical protein
MHQLWYVNQDWFKLRDDLSETEENQLYDLVGQIEEPISQIRQMFWAKEEEKAAEKSAATETSSNLVSNTATA